MTSIAALFEAAYASYAAGRRDQARALFAAIADEAPEHLPTQINLAVIDAEDSRPKEACARIARLLDRGAGFDLRLGTVAHALRNGGAWAEARDMACRALVLAPYDETGFFTLGGVLLRERQLAPAECAFRRALILRPDDAAAEYGLALLLLTQDRRREGYRHYPALRRLDFPARIVPPDAPYWRGEDLTGKTLLVFARLGLGDTIQFFRYLPRAAQIVIQVQKALVSLLSANTPHRVIAPGENPGPFHYCVPIDELPAFVDADPGVPYLVVPPGEAPAWRNPKAFNLGIVHAGRRTHSNDGARSIAPALLCDVTQIPGVNAISLQVPASDTLKGAKAIGGGFGDFLDTAQALNRLDLVLSVDTGVAHLAGAMGRPLWLLLPHDVDWRWGLEGEATRWYPTARLFRQGPDRDWTKVIAAVRERIEGMR